MGPPPGWHRLRLLRQIGDQLVAGVEQFLLVDNVVAVEDGTALVPGQEHGDPLWDVCADQVTGGGAPAIVEEAGRHPGRLAGGAPRRAPTADGDAVAVEDERAAGIAARSPSRQRLGDGRRDGEDASHQRLRARGRESDDAAGLVDLVPGEAEEFLLAPAGVVGEVEDVLPRGGQVGADGEVLGVLEETLAGGILAEPVGEAGHGVEPAPVDGERAHAVERRGLPVDGAGGRPGGAPGELVLADLVRGERGGPCGAAEEGGEMGDPAAGGAVGPELPHLVVLEVGVAEIARESPGVAVEPVSCGVMGWVPPWWRPRAGGVRPHSLWWARQARGMCGGEGTAMCGEPRVAAECTCTEREFGRCSRPTVRGRRREAMTDSVGLYAMANRIPSMGGREIGPVLRNLARHAPAGTSIVEVGTWLGAGTAQLALGIRERARPSEVALHCYDRWQANRSEITKAAGCGVHLAFEEDTLPRVRRTLDPFGVPVEYHKGELLGVQWDGGPISVYVDDATKMPEAFLHALRTFGPSWVPGTTRLVFMDYDYWRTSGASAINCCYPALISF